MALDEPQQPTRQHRRGELTCPRCGQRQWTWLRQWYLGRDTVWYCDFCAEMVSHLRVVP